MSKRNLWIPELLFRFLLNVDFYKNLRCKLLLWHFCEVLSMKDLLLKRENSADFSVFGIYDYSITAGNFAYQKISHLFVTTKDNW